jgi:hypothetical protein
MKKICSALCFLLYSVAPALASVTVNTPSNGSDVNSPFTLTADASTCSSQTVTAITYSLDSGSDSTIVHTQNLKEEVAANTGSHTLRVKAWGNKGMLCVTEVSINVTSGSGGSTIPSGAAVVSNAQALSNWIGVHDARTPGSATGSMSLSSSPSRSGKARKFVTKYGNAGGERYSLHFGDDTSATNFLYDTWVYISGSAAKLANLEMDINQVMPNGWTVIFGFQCDGYSGTWDYTANKGTPENPASHWEHSDVACNPRSWSTNAWHHVQVEYSRDSSGVATYKSVTFDGVEHTLNYTVLAAKVLGWGPSLTTNFQVDGLGSSGTVTLYMDDLTISRW